MRLIDANAIYDAVERRYQVSGGVEHRCERDFLDLICSVHTIDAVPVVRCAECKHYKPGKYFKDINFCHRLPYYAEKGGLNVADNDFCSYGERRSDE